jgi:hypothetical protein
MKIKTDELRQSFEVFMRHLDDTGKTEISIEEDYYWNVPQDRRYNPLQEPKEFTMGQLTDDWKEVRQISSGERDVIGYP